MDEAGAADGMDAGSGSGAPVTANALPDGWRWREVCGSEDLRDGADGVRFEVPGAVESLPAFVVRSEGEVRGYLNQCRHVPVELDWQPGRFFDDTGLYLICSTHGAMYRASDGRCAGGPCRGQGLFALRVMEADGVVWVAVQDGNA